jgi:8-oxo-dGTP pyrophosphatase MutT (NUDIX family)
VADYIRWLRERTGPDPIQLAFASAVVRGPAGLLLQRRADLDAWGFPGGAIELDESAAEAARREVREETGLTIEIQRLLGVYTKYRQAYPNGDVAQPITVFFEATPAAGETVPAEPPDIHETLEVRWFRPEEVPLLFSQQHQDALGDHLAGRTGVFR